MGSEGGGGGAGEGEGGGDEAIAITDGGDGEANGGLGAAWVVTFTSAGVREPGVTEPGAESAAESAWLGSGSGLGMG